MRPRDRPCPGALPHPSCAARGSTPPSRPPAPPTQDSRPVPHSGHREAFALRFCFRAETGAASLLRAPLGAGGGPVGRVHADRLSLRHPRFSGRYRIFFKREVKRHSNPVEFRPPTSLLADLGRDWQWFGAE